MTAAPDLPEVAYYFQLIRDLVDDNDPRVSQVSLCHPSRLLDEAGPINPDFAKLLGGEAGIQGLVRMRDRQVLIGKVELDDYTPFFEAIRQRLTGDDPARVHMWINCHHFRWITRAPAQLILDRPYDFWLPSRDDVDFIMPQRGIISLDESGYILWSPMT